MVTPEKPKRRVAVFFGGQSPEHDVSIVTGLQVMQALSQSRYEVIPVYVTLSGDWLTGDQLRDRSSFIPDAEIRKRLTRVTLGVSNEGFGLLRPYSPSIWGSKSIEFDVAIPAFHGALGEDGCFQGIFELATLPYAGMRRLGSAIAMDKAFTKAVVRAKTIVPQLPAIDIFKQAGRSAVPFKLPSDWKFPVIVKPAHMGSSIGVAKASSPEEVDSIARAIFIHDGKAIVEPYISQRKEFNVAVRRAQDGNVALSAVEMPKTQSELLDFKEKYLSSSGAKKGAGSEGMLSLTRDINPLLDDELQRKLLSWSTDIFNALEGSGTPRLDYIYDERTGELWFNEINPCPGSFAYFLWEAAETPVLFSELLDHLIDEAFHFRNITITPTDPVPSEARLFKRK